MPNKKHIGIVKKRLWASGYAVSERLREMEGFDLLVEGKYRLSVGSAVPGIANLVAKVQSAFGDSFVRYFVVPENGKAQGAREVFGLPSKKDTHGKKTKEKGGAKATEVK